MIKGPPARVRQTFLAVFDLETVKQELVDLFVADAEHALGDADAPDAADELALDERMAYKHKVTKWIKATLENIESFAFWYVLHASYQARSPLTAFFAKLCKDGAEGLTCGSGPPRDYPIVKLICVRIPEIQAMFMDLLMHSERWIAECFHNAALAVAKPNEPDPREQVDCVELSGMAFNLALQNYTAFERRIVQPFSR